MSMGYTDGIFLPCGVTGTGLALQLPTGCCVSCIEPCVLFP